MTPNTLAWRLERCIRGARTSFVTADRYLAWRTALDELAPEHVKGRGDWSSSSPNDAAYIAMACGNADQIWAIFVMLFPELVEKADLSGYRNDIR